MISTSEKSNAAVIANFRTADGDGLEKISRSGLLSLTLEEMQTIQRRFQDVGRDPTDVELETIAQTWSEHCYHKTFRGKYSYREENLAGGMTIAPTGTRTYENLLKETIVKATTDLELPWCLSVFKDNAGVIAFDAQDAVCFKVETHNHPSALEPYGGAGTGIGGVIRDVLGCGLGAKPVMNTDVFCFGELDTPLEKIPKGVLLPRRIARGVISGVRDYGNRMGIPTANGAVYFDAGYIGNPLVFCGTVGIMPVGMIEKTVEPGDLVVAVGGRTGRDGIHGATFSSAPLESGITSSVVQIGHAIMEKKTMDVLLAARNKNLYRSVTDCGAGGFSSAVGELGKDTGVLVRLEAAPLKYPGLAPWEIWISESQERMALAVPPAHWNTLRTMFQQEDVEAVVIGEFTNDKKLTITYEGKTVGQIDMNFLHDGVPRATLEAVWNGEEFSKRHVSALAPTLSQTGEGEKPSRSNIASTFLALLQHPNVASKQSIVRQYDHEVQGGSVIKPFMGAQHDAPTDACVFRPKLSSWQGVAISNGLNPELGKWDPYIMAKVAIDEAYRNLVAVGGGLTQAAILDNFCWGSSKDPLELAGLVRAAEGCREAATAYQLPFISGKDSFNNTWKTDDGALHSIPPTLLVSAIGVIENVRRCLTSSFRAAGNLVYVIGETKEAMKGSLAARLWNETTTELPDVNFAQAKSLYKKLQAAMKHDIILSCHDLSDGGVAVAAAEMAFGGDGGVDLVAPVDADVATLLFSETPSRLLVEIAPQNKAAFEQALGLMFLQPVGLTTKKAEVAVKQGETILFKQPTAKLKGLWKAPLEHI